MAETDLSAKMEATKLEEKGDEAPAGDAIYTSELRGSDENGEGTKKVPYKTILQVGIFVTLIFT